MLLMKKTPGLLAAMLLIVTLCVTGCNNKGSNTDLVVQNPADLPGQGNNQPLMIVTPSLSQGEVGQFFNQTIVASGGMSPYNFVRLSGNIPSGLRLSTNGALSGTPTVSGTFQFTVRVSDHSTPIEQASRSYTMAVNQPGGGVPANTPPVFTTVPQGAALVHQTGRQYQFDFDASDIDGDPLSFQVVTPPTNGPAAIDATSGVFSWTPGVDRVYPITVGVSDGTTRTDYTFAVNCTPNGTGNPPNQPPVFTSFPGTDAYDGVLFQYQAAVSDPENDPISWALTQNPMGMVIDANGNVTWTPIAAQVGQTFPITVQASDGTNMVNQNFNLTVQLNPNQPSGVRVVISNFTAGPPTQNVDVAQVQYWEAMDPASPANHVLLGTMNYQWVNRGTVRTALTGTKHNMRAGGDRPHEVNLNSVGAYIQCPSIVMDNPMNPGTPVPASVRLYLSSDEETVQDPTGTMDTLAIVDSMGLVQVVNFPSNIHEEMYVPRDFARQAIPFVVVVSNTGRNMWIIRCDRGAWTSSGQIMNTVDLTAIGGSSRIQHNSVTLAGSNLWFATDDNAGDRLFRCPLDGGAMGQNPACLPVALPAGSGTVPTEISSVFERSGNGTRIAIVAGNDMTTSIFDFNTSNPAPTGVWRDVWVVDGQTQLVVRSTEFETNRPMNGPDVRLIETFDSGGATFNENFSAASSNDTGGNDRRTRFGEVTTVGNSTFVGHTINFDGTMVGFVVMEANSGSSDGGSDTIRDEVYVCGVQSSSSHDVVRVTSSPSATDPDGTRVAAQSNFQLNNGMCTGIAFPQLISGNGRNERLYFCYGPHEFATHLYSAEFVQGQSPIVHASTADRTTGMPAGPNGFENQQDEFNLYIASNEGADQATGSSIFSLIRLGGQTNVQVDMMTGGVTIIGITPDQRGRLQYLDLRSSNSQVSGTLGICTDVIDAATNQPLQVYQIAEDRTYLSSGFEPQTPPLGNGRSDWFPTISSMVTSVPGPATTGVNAGRAFVVAELNPGVENLYSFSLNRPNVGAVDMTNLTTPGTIHDVNVYFDGSAIAVHRGTSTVAFPNDRNGFSVMGDRLRLIPSFQQANQANGGPGAKQFTALEPNPQIPSTQFLSRTGAWVRTDRLNGGQMRIVYFYASGMSTQNGATVMGTMRVSQIEVDLSQNPVTLGAPTEMDPNATPGAVTFKGSGVDP